MSMLISLLLLFGGTPVIVPPVKVRPANLTTIAANFEPPGGFLLECSNGNEPWVRRDGEKLYLSCTKR